MGTRTNGGWQCFRTSTPPNERPWLTSVKLVSVTLTHICSIFRANYELAGSIWLIRTIRMNKAELFEAMWTELKRWRKQIWECKCIEPKGRMSKLFFPLRKQMVNKRYFDGQANRCNLKRYSTFSWNCAHNAIWNLIRNLHYRICSNMTFLFGNLNLPLMHLQVSKGQ